MMKRESRNQRKGDHVGNAAAQIIGKRTVQQRRTGEAIEAIHVTPLVLFLFFFSFYSRGHMCCPCVMLMSLVPVPGTFLLLSLSDIPLAIVPCNEVAPHGTPHGGLSSLTRCNPNFCTTNSI